MYHALKKILSILVIMALGVLAFFYREPIVEYSSVLIKKVYPARQCTNPIKYSLGRFDDKFGIGREKFLNEIAKAERIWENLEGKNLFEYEDGGELKVNLIYDYRQEATDKLKSLGYVINNDRATYDSLKARYTSLVTSYKTNKSALESEIASIEAAKSTYSKQVEYWNGRGGAPKNEYNKLQEIQTTINNRVSAAIKKQSEINSTAETVNSLITVMNKLIDELNLNVEKYNTTTKATGEEFNGGQYVDDASGQEVDIYQFGSEEKLVRVLAHELGHALGLDHVDDPEAIMYKLNQGNNESLTEADIVELDRVCNSDK